MKSAFTKKNRLVLIRSPKSVNKVSWTLVPVKWETHFSYFLRMGFFSTQKSCHMNNRKINLTEIVKYEDVGLSTIFLYLFSFPLLLSGCNIDVCHESSTEWLLTVITCFQVFGSWPRWKELSGLVTEGIWRRGEAWGRFESGQGYRRSANTLMRLMCALAPRQKLRTTKQDIHRGSE